MARPPARLTLAVLLAVSAAAGGPVPGARADEDIPAMGARVRAQVPGLWPGWHMGMFSLSTREIERLQVSSLYDGRTRFAPADPDEWTYAGETWREVPMDPLRQAERQCPILDR